MVSIEWQSQPPADFEDPKDNFFGLLCGLHIIFVYRGSSNKSGIDSSRSYKFKTPTPPPPRFGAPARRPAAHLGPANDFSTRGLVSRPP